MQQRADHYATVFPNWPPLRVDDRWLDGMWMLGQNYRGSGFYGAYPPGYLARIAALFPDRTRTLHLFSGSLPAGDYTRFDLVAREDASTVPEVVGDATTLSRHFAPHAFDFVMADPPYSATDAVRYGTPMPNRRKVLAELHKVVEPGGHLVWLDTVLPMFRKDAWHLWGLIGIVRSTNHRVRLASMFERLPDKEQG